MLIAMLNIIVAVIFAAVIFDGAQDLKSARNDLRFTRDSDRLLTQIESQAGRLQSLIHRYFTQPNADLLKEVTDLRAQLLDSLVNRALVDPILSTSAEDLLQSTERFVVGFSDLRDIQATISATYDNQVLKPAQEMAGLYAIVEDATKERNALIWPSLNKSHESFSQTLVLTTGFYLSP